MSHCLIDNLFEREYRKVGQEKKCIGIFFSSGERGLNIGSFTISLVVSHVCRKYCGPKCRLEQQAPLVANSLTVNGACNSISGITERFMRVRTRAVD